MTAPSASLSVAAKAEYVQLVVVPNDDETTWLLTNGPQPTLTLTVPRAAFPALSTGCMVICTLGLAVIAIKPAEEPTLVDATGRDLKAKPTLLRPN